MEWILFRGDICIYHMREKKKKYIWVRVYAEKRQVTIRKMWWSSAVNYSLHIEASNQFFTPVLWAFWNSGVFWHPASIEDKRAVQRIESPSLLCDIESSPFTVHSFSAGRFFIVFSYSGYVSELVHFSKFIIKTDGHQGDTGRIGADQVTVHGFAQGVNSNLIRTALG